MNRDWKRRNFINEESLINSMRDQLGKSLNNFESFYWNDCKRSNGFYDRFNKKGKEMEDECINFISSNHFTSISSKIGTYIDFEEIKGA